MMKLLFQYLMIALFASACHNTGKPEQPTITDTTAAQPTPAKQHKTIADEYKIIGDSVALPPFEIIVQLSQTAEKKLKDAQETIIVSAILSGIPKDTTMQEYRQWGAFALGNVQVEIPTPGTARFDGAKILKSDFDLLGNKDINVLINVYSGRRSDDNNLLSCDILELPISQVCRQKNVLKGKLIYE